MTLDMRIAGPVGRELAVQKNAGEAEVSQVWLGVSGFGSSTTFPAGMF